MSGNISSCINISPARKVSVSTSMKLWITQGRLLFSECQYHFLLSGGTQHLPLRGKAFSNELLPSFWKSIHLSCRGHRWRLRQHLQGEHQMSLVPWALQEVEHLFMLTFQLNKPPEMTWHLQRWTLWRLIRSGSPLTLIPPTKTSWKLPSLMVFLMSLNREASKRGFSPERKVKRRMKTKLTLFPLNLVKETCFPYIFLAPKDLNLQLSSSASLPLPFSPFILLEWLTDLGSSKPGKVLLAQGAEGFSTQPCF